MEARLTALDRPSASRSRLAGPYCYQSVLADPLFDNSV